MKSIFSALIVLLFFFLIPIHGEEAATGGIYGQIQNKLVVWDGKKLKDVDTASLMHTKYFAIYYSAAWCNPCHIFTPELVKFYNKFKPAHPNFELIFVSLDNDEASMTAYMKEMSMPWTALKFSELSHNNSGIQKYMGDGIPDLVLVDANGKVLSDSFDKGEYVGPNRVVNDIQLVVK